MEPLLLAALGAVGTVIGAIATFLTRRGERQTKARLAEAENALKERLADGDHRLRIQLTEHDWVTGEFAQLRTIWTGEIARLTLRVEQLEQAAKERSRRIETLETAVVQLEAENDELRGAVVSLGGNPPPRRIRLADLGLTFTQLRAEGGE